MQAHLVQHTQRDHCLAHHLHLPQVPLHGGQDGGQAAACDQHLQAVEGWGGSSESGEGTLTLLPPVPAMPTWRCPVLPACQRATSQEAALKVGTAAPGGRYSPGPAAPGTAAQTAAPWACPCGHTCLQPGGRSVQVTRQQAPRPTSSGTGSGHRSSCCLSQQCGVTLVAGHVPCSMGRLTLCDDLHSIAVGQAQAVCVRGLPLPPHQRHQRQAPVARHPLAAQVLQAGLGGAAGRHSAQARSGQGQARNRPGAGSGQTANEPAGGAASATGQLPRPPAACSALWPAPLPAAPAPAAPPRRSTPAGRSPPGGTWRHLWGEEEAQRGTGDRAGVCGQHLYAV